jgi:hypothetical protein
LAPPQTNSWHLDLAHYALVRTRGLGLWNNLKQTLAPFILSSHSPLGPHTRHPDAAMVGETQREHTNIVTVQPREGADAAPRLVEHKANTHARWLLSPEIRGSLQFLAFLSFPTRVLRPTPTRAHATRARAAVTCLVVPRPAPLLRGGGPLQTEDSAPRESASVCAGDRRWGDRIGIGCKDMKEAIDAMHASVMVHACLRMWQTVFFLCLCVCVCGRGRETGIERGLAEISIKQ